MLHYKRTNIKRIELMKTTHRIPEHFRTGFARSASVVLICARRVFHKEQGSEKLAKNEESSQSLQVGAVIPSQNNRKLFDLLQLPATKKIILKRLRSFILFWLTRG